MQHAKDYWTVTRIHSPTRPLDASLPPLYKPHGGLDTPSASLKGRVYVHFDGDDSSTPP
jgi:hypothetical protein